MMNGYGQNQGQRSAFGEQPEMQQRVNPVQGGGMSMPPMQQAGWTAGMNQVANALKMRMQGGMQPGMQPGMMPPGMAQSPMASVFGPSQSAPAMGTGGLY